MSEKLYKALRRVVIKNEPHSQLLSLTVGASSGDWCAWVAWAPMVQLPSEEGRDAWHLQVLETAIKNCHPAVYRTLAESELWLELVKLAADSSVDRVSPPPTWLLWAL
jgi:hypothetical protein